MLRIKHVHHRPGPLGLFWALFMAIPFYFLWNTLAPIYAPGLAPLYQHLPFWHCVGLFLLGAVIRSGLMGW